jgi:S1-C subfamily serine protease
MKSLSVLLFIAFLSIIPMTAQEEYDDYGRQQPDGQAGEAMTPDRIEEILGLRGIPVTHILRVPEHSILDEMRLRKGDLILALNGKNMNEYRGFRNFITEMRRDCVAGVAVLDVFRFEPRDGSYFLDRVAAEIGPEDQDLERYAGFTSTFNFIVVEVVPDSPADRMGIRPGDFIQEINGSQVPNLAGPTAIESLVERIAAESNAEIELKFGRWEYLDDGRMRGRFQRARGNL